MFGVFCVAMFIHVFFMFPETAGKTLEEVESIFTDPTGPLYIGTPAWKTKKNTGAALAHERGIYDDEKLGATHYESPERTAEVTKS